jgi:hypothetical protein
VVLIQQRRGRNKLLERRGILRRNVTVWYKEPMQIHGVEHKLSGRQEGMSGETIWQSPKSMHKLIRNPAVLSTMQPVNISLCYYCAPQEARAFFSEKSGHQFLCWDRKVGIK